MLPPDGWLPGKPGGDTTVDMALALVGQHDVGVSCPPCEGRNRAGCSVQVAGASGIDDLDLTTRLSEPLLEGTRLQDDGSTVDALVG